MDRKIPADDDDSEILQRAANALRTSTTIPKTCASTGVLILNHQSLACAWVNPPNGDGKWVYLHASEAHRAMADYDAKCGPWDVDDTRMLQVCKGDGNPRTVINKL